jgi:hypothetical protein
MTELPIGSQTGKARWMTKQQLAEHLRVTRRWIEAQQAVGLPHLHTPSMNRYQLIEVEEWLRSRYGVARDGGD